LATVRV